ACCDRTELLEFVEEPLDHIALAIELVVEGGEAFARWHQPDIGDDTARGHLIMQCIAVISPVGKQNLAGCQCGEHIGSRAAVMGLTSGELQADRTSPSIDKGMDFGGQATARATHASGSPPFLAPFAPC